MDQSQACDAALVEQLHQLLGSGSLLLEPLPGAGGDFAANRNDTQASSGVFYGVIKESAALVACWNGEQTQVSV
jgi:hypothetical protein